MYLLDTNVVSDFIKGRTDFLDRLERDRVQRCGVVEPDDGDGIVDLDCRVHGTTNVLVTDASVFPSCIRVNAQWTTMAMAEYATGRGDPFG